MDIAIPLGSLFLGVALGAWGYRYWLKKNPASLERIAREIRELGEKVK